MNARVLKISELLANLAIVCVAIMIGVVLISRHPTGSRDELLNHDLIKPGARIAVNGVDWRVNKATLLVAVRDGCGACQASADFYQRLATSPKKAKLIILVQTSESAGREYLQRLKVQTDTVVHAEFRDLHIPATPTIVLVNAAGLVVKTWLGKLNAQQEAEVISLVS